MEDCVFCQIISRNIPSFTIYEDKLVQVFLAKPSIRDGHMLIIPKKHRVDLFELTDNELGRIAVVSQKMGKLLISKLGATGINLLNASGKDAQQSVFHFHLHVVPRFPDDGLDFWFGKFQSVAIDFESTFNDLIL